MPNHRALIDRAVESNAGAKKARKNRVALASR